MNVAERLCDTIFMIFEGRKVLDGTLAQIQRRFPTDRVRVRLADNAEMPEGLPGVSRLSREDGFDVVWLGEGGSEQALLQRLAAVRAVEHFEVVRPTLHDIFVDIARPPRTGDPSP